MSGLIRFDGLDSALLVACVTVLLILPIRMGKEQKQDRPQCACSAHGDEIGGSVSTLGAFQRVRGISTMATRAKPRIIFLLYYRLRLSFLVFLLSSRLSVLFKTLAGEVASRLQVPVQN